MQSCIFLIGPPATGRTGRNFEFVKRFKFLFCKMRAKIELFIFP